MRLRVAGARICDPASGLDRVGDLCCAGGRVVAAGETPPGFQAERTVEAAGLVACPGLVDLSARLREPGATHKASIASETRAAAAGGITTLCCPPDTDPVADTPAVVELIHQRAAAAGWARVEVIGALTHALGGRQLAAMGALAEAGCVAVGNADAAVADTEVMRRALEYAATLGLAVIVRPEDPWLAEGRCVHEGATAARLGLAGIPAVAETVAVARELHLAQASGARIHFSRLSTAGACTLVRSARAGGLAVSADCAAHQLHLTEEAVGGFDARAHLRPPLRSAADRAALRAAVADGTLDAICSDHQPHEVDAKLNPFPETEPGISALETLLALVLELVDEGVLELPAALARLTCGPAAVIGRERATLAPGAPADLCLFDPAARWRLEPEQMRSASHHTPFAGRELHGRVRLTVLGGRIVHEG